MKRSLTALLLTIFSSVLFSQLVFANRPAMDESVEESSNVAEPAGSRQTDTRTESLSSVDITMQQKTQQQGDVLQLPVKEIQPGDVIKIKIVDFPRRGMTMDKVQNELGQPVSKSGGVGQPPITRWTYPDRDVYFEYSTVLHVVAHQ